ncbi:MAG: hypothetical protein DRI37_07170, partial [Chloroflexi bacterium]
QIPRDEISLHRSGTFQSCFAFQMHYEDIEGITFWVFVFAETLVFLYMFFERIRYIGAMISEGFCFVDIVEKISRKI